MAKLLRIAVMAFVMAGAVPIIGQVIGKATGQISGVAFAQNLPLDKLNRDFNPSPPLPIIQVQAVDPSVRISQLEEQVRQLTGRLEELGFQMLQMQEQIRQMQQDNEFRFNDLENAKSTDQSNAAPKVSRPSQNETAQVTIGDAQFDSEGNLIGGGSSNSGAAELYKTGYGFVLSGDYGQAVTTFEAYLDQYPSEQQASDAQFWLGESLYSQGEYKDAARAFLNGYNNYPDANKAPDTLLKLGMSLFALDNQETACATYDEVLSKYPAASKAIQDKVASEQSRAQC